MAGAFRPATEADQAHLPDHRLKEADVHDRRPPQKQNLTRRPLPQPPVPTRERLLEKNISRRTHAALQVSLCRANATISPLNQKSRKSDAKACIPKRESNRAFSSMVLPSPSTPRL